MESESIFSKLRNISGSREAEQIGEQERLGTIGSTYENLLLKTSFNNRVLQRLDTLGYLEYYLIPQVGKYSQEQQLDRKLLMSCIALMNVRSRENNTYWEQIRTQEYIEQIKRVIRESLQQQQDMYIYTIQEKTQTIQFYINIYRVIELDYINEITLPYVNSVIWLKLSKQYMKQLFMKYPRLLAIYKKVKQTHINNNNQNLHLMSNLLNIFWQIIGNLPQSPTSQEDLTFCEKFLELLIDLMSQIPTRKFLRDLLLDDYFITKCKLTQLISDNTNTYNNESTNTYNNNSSVFYQLTDILDYYINIELHQETGLALPQTTQALIHFDNIKAFQQLLYTKFKDKLSHISIRNASSLDDPAALEEILEFLEDHEIINVCQMLFINFPLPNDQLFTNSAFKHITHRQFMYQVLKKYIINTKNVSYNNTQCNPPYPTELLLWSPQLLTNDTNQNYYQSIPLHKLNLQFLSYDDYLNRNFNLFRLESAYEIKQEIEDIIPRMSPQYDQDTGVFKGFGGWSRMAVELKNFTIHEVKPPRVGSIVPGSILAEVTYSTTGMQTYLRKEWENLKEYDVILLVSFYKKKTQEEESHQQLNQNNFCQQYGIQYIRGAEVVSHLDENRNNLSNYDNKNRKQNKLPEGTLRNILIKLDEHQYKNDLENISETEADVYGNFKLIIRRRSKVNTFKAILSTIKELSSEQIQLPLWLEEIILGYGDPADATYQTVSQHNFIPIDFKDTFLDSTHYEETAKNNANLPEYYRTQQYQSNNTESNNIHYLGEHFQLLATGNLLQHKYLEYNFRESTIGYNTIRFTPKQIEAIVSSMNHGLTLIVGPPGTGKTDVAVQVTNLLYNNFPNERTIIITHSNNALNDIFEKIEKLNIHERHLLRLGAGEKHLKTTKDFSRSGRINYLLERRLLLLEEVNKLAKSLNTHMYDDFTCETANIFYELHVLTRWKEFENILPSLDTPNIGRYFPFLYFLGQTSFLIQSKDSNTSQNNQQSPFDPWFSAQEKSIDIQRAYFYWEIIQSIFKEIQECRMFELIRSNKERGNYVTSKQAKIIAMTCVHAAIKRQDLVQNHFEYDNIIIEESAQILEIETLICLLLQKNKFGGNQRRLKRIILLGDQNQLPPIIHNNQLQQYSHMEQSMFTRFLRLGVPALVLDKQGRMRESLLELYRWRYQNLETLENVRNSEQFLRANAGFVYEYQFINVESEQGESAPMAYFYQNLAEAEYIVAVYMYMRLIGYPANKITILTTYNGQKFLIRDIIQKKCAWNSQIGKPSKITTVDKYQGQQNDYILLSLVRTENIGHIRDPRRLVVALSRARLGLYVFGKFDLFHKCVEIQQSIRLFQLRPLTLLLLTHEKYTDTQNRLITHSTSQHNHSSLHTTHNYNDMYQLLAQLFSE